MRFAILPLAFILAATPAAAQMRQPAPLSGRALGINGTSQAGIANHRQFVVRPYVVAGNAGWRHELRQIDRRIRQARADGELTRGQARALRRQVNLVRSLGASYAAGGYSESEPFVLNAQTFALRDLAQAPNRPVLSGR